MKRLNKTAKKLFYWEGGFTLLETLIAVAILAAIGVTLANAVNTNSESTKMIDDRNTAANLISQYFEEIKFADYAYEYSVTDFPNIEIPQRFSVDISTTFSDDAGLTWDDEELKTLQKISITVSYANDGRTFLSLCTFRTKF